MIKDEEEIAILRESSRLNDLVIDELIPWVGKGLSEKELNTKVREIYKNMVLMKYLSTLLQHMLREQQIHTM